MDHRRKDYPAEETVVIRAFSIAWLHPVPECATGVRAGNTVNEGSFTIVVTPETPANLETSIPPTGAALFEGRLFHARCLIGAIRKGENKPKLTYAGWRNDASHCLYLL